MSKEVPCRRSTTSTHSSEGRAAFSGQPLATPKLGAHEVHGDIPAHWASLGRERSNLGYATSDERREPAGVTRFSEAEGGTILWTPTGGTEVRKRID